MSFDFGTSTYLLMNLAFGLVAVAVLWRWVRKLDWRAFGMATAVLLQLTLIFDNLIVGFGIVGYDASKLLGILMPVAPIEDFGYAILATLLVPAIWLSLGAVGRKDRPDGE